MQPNLFKKSRVAFRTNTKLALLTTPLQSNERSSFSFVLTLAEFMNSIKKLIPPGFVPLLKRKSSTHTKTIKTEAENYFEPWCDYLFSLLANGKITTNSDQVILIGRLDEESFKILQATHSFQIKHIPFNLEKKIALIEAINLVKNAGNQEVDQKKKKIGIINFSTSTLNQDKLKPKIHIEGVLSGIFYNPGEEWRAFRILRNDIPKVEDLQDYDTIILSGSSYSVNGLSPQMKQFRQVLIDTLKVNKKLKVMGICFGHQFLAHSENIEVVTKTLDKGLLNINFSLEESADVPYLKQLIKTEYRFLRLYKYHSDHVTVVPEHSFKIGESSKCNIETLISKDKRIFSFQFHPEYTEEYIHAYESRLNGEEPKLSKKHDDFHHKSIEIIRKTMRSFLDWTIQY